MLKDKSSFASSIVFVGVCAFVVGWYAWMGVVGVTEMGIYAPATSHYNLLVEGFRHGQLSLYKTPPPELGQLADPYDPVANHRYRLPFGQPYGLHDMSYYKGKLYLYFGVTPALLLFWPWTALTGHYLFQRYAVAIFCAVGFLAGATILRALQRRYFPEVGGAVVAAGVLALGLATGVPILQQRAEFYEVAISCGYALIMLALGAVWLALHDPPRRGWWLAAASLALGLAVGARPFLLLGASILVVPLIQAWHQSSSATPRRPPWSLLVAALLPLVLCGLGLMLYNYLRFDNPFEFGQRHQLAAQRQDTGRLFSLHYLWFNFRVYFLEPVRWSRQFPFAGDIVSPAVPPGHGVVEDAFGALTNIPVVWLALAVPFVWRRRAEEARTALRGFVAAVAMLFVACASVLCLFYLNCIRYEVEFLPALVLLAVTGILGVERALAGRPRWRLVARAGWGLLLSFSVAFNLLAALDRYAAQRNQLGNVFYSSGRIPEAIALYERALWIKPAYVEAHYNLGVAWSQVPGRLKDAIAQYEEALRLQPDHAAAHNNLGLAWSQVPGRLKDAIAQYEEALRLQPDSAEAHNNLGNAWSQVPGRLKDAIAQYEAALRLKPDSAEAHNNLGLAWSKMPGRLNDAAAQYEEALRLKSDYVEAHCNLGNAWSKMPGRLNDATAQYEEALRLKPDYAEAHNNLGVVWAQMPGRLQDAAAQYEEALRLKPNYAQAHYNLGNAWAQMPGRLEDAAAQYEAALRLKPDYAEAHNNLGLAWAQMPGRLKDAIAQFEKALRLKPDFAPGWHNLGVSWFHLGNLPAAAAAFREELRLSPDDPAAQQALAAALQPAQDH
jgi:tetratricopeptide (TPR) repeat protein